MIQVLLVEDEELIRKGLAYTFQWADFDCVVVGEAANGEEGVTCIQTLQPDIVITDIKMPLKDGLEMIRICKEELCVPCEFVIISGYAEFGYAQKAITYGVSNFLLKPIDHKVLEEVIQKLVAKIEEKRTVEHIKAQVKPLEEFELLNISIYTSPYTNYSFYYTKRIIAYIMEHYQEKITLEEIAKEIGVSVSTIKTDFKADTHQSFHDFLHKYRIQMALQYMFESNLRVYEIAQKVGYSEYKYFSKVFKKYLGHTPSEFMNLELFLRQVE